MNSRKQKLKIQIFTIENYEPWLNKKYWILMKIDNSKPFFSLESKAREQKLYSNFMKCKNKWNKIKIRPGTKK